MMRSRSVSLAPASPNRVSYPRDNMVPDTKSRRSVRLSENSIRISVEYYSARTITIEPGLYVRSSAGSGISSTNRAVPYAKTIAFRPYVSSHPTPEPIPTHTQRRREAKLASCKDSSYLPKSGHIHMGLRYYYNVTPCIDAPLNCNYNSRLFYKYFTFFSTIK
ncbi:unnamed protein product [Leptidea sinapis]|uniref:Uncharacterized protein n=1 Tax=Leptidea sinapis TaxID=189913 RepID=A0A5E4R618_9NEOP|nr:unnamed protein product [Leptidea sinapis]